MVVEQLGRLDLDPAVGGAGDRWLTLLVRRVGELVGDAEPVVGIHRPAAYHTAPLAPLLLSRSPQPAPGGPSDGWGVTPEGDGLVELAADGGGVVVAHAIL